GGGAYGRMLASLSGKMIPANSRADSNNQATRMPEYGNNPVWASPARGRRERLRAGRIADTNSAQGEDHSTSHLGASFMPCAPFLHGPMQFRFCLPSMYPSHSLSHVAAPAPMYPSRAPRR